MDYMKNKSEGWFGGLFKKDKEPDESSEFMDRVDGLSKEYGIPAEDLLKISRNKLPTKENPWTFHINDKEITVWWGKDSDGRVNSYKGTIDGEDFLDLSQDAQFKDLQTIFRVIGNIRRQLHFDRVALRSMERGDVADHLDDLDVHSPDNKPTTEIPG